MLTLESKKKVVGVLLAGGLARRMGHGEKPLKMLGNRFIIDWVLERATPQVDQLILNVNSNSELFSRFNLPLISDTIEGHLGPLAGILTGLQWTRCNVPDADWVASFATDAPFFPKDMIQKFLDATKDEEVEIVCACSRGRSHPVFALWSTSLMEDLEHAITENEIRKIDKWTENHNICYIDFDGFDSRIDPFLNINYPEDLIQAEQLLSLLNQDKSF